MTLQKELHDLKNKRRFHIGFRALPYPFMNGSEHEYQKPEELKAVLDEYSRWLRAVYPTEVSLAERMWIEWSESGLVEHNPDDDLYVSAKARAAFKFISAADYKIAVYNDSGDTYGDFGEHGSWPLVYSVYGERYRRRKADADVETCADCGGDVQPLHACPDFPTKRS
jgi:hypothetical protein